ncbi:MAG: hypothetical protein M1818_003937 [Claussenomyces sp. TS43310]|nr:MAG: hypothetical protein M1818_003937 [Claussenomyces sp. TS43310]
MAPIKIPIYRQPLFSWSTSRVAYYSTSSRLRNVSGLPYTSNYVVGQPTRGPLAEAGTPRLSPKRLKEYLDRYVIGQERSKKMMATAIYNHYQRVQEMNRQAEEAKEKEAQKSRDQFEFAVHAVEAEYPGQVPTVNFEPPPGSNKRIEDALAEDVTPLTIEKSNVMMIGPTGVGKTLIAKTLARVLDVPFSITDCNPLTQSGYIGEDADVCVHRLFAESGNDPARCERGIIFLDEFDKIARAKVSHGKDVSGEGVQQALLKIIEGTNITVTVKSEKSSRTGPGSVLGMAGGALPPKTETYTIRTDNILFILGGAFVDLDKIILNRVSRGSMGFGALVRSKSSPYSLESSSPNPHKLDPELFKMVPMYDPSEPDFNTLSLVTPADYQAFGLIPEIIGRVPITIALSHLTPAQIVRILTEPRSSLLAQYQALFAGAGAELKVTTGALHAVGELAVAQGSGARGLRMILECVLARAMYEVPDSRSVKYVCVTRDAVRDPNLIAYFSRGDAAGFHGLIAAEEEAWQHRRGEDQQQQHATDATADVDSFQEYRQLAVSGL